MGDIDKKKKSFLPAVPPVPTKQERGGAEEIPATVFKVDASSFHQLYAV